MYGSSHSRSFYFF